MAWLELMESRTPGFCKAHGYVTPERTDSAPFRWGTAFESAVIKQASRSYGTARAARITDREGLYAVDFDGNAIDPLAISDAGGITCHIDGRYSTKVLHEGKTTTDMAYRYKWGTPGTDRIPADYQVQVQHQMCAVRQAIECVVSVLVFPDTQDAFEAMGWRVVPLDTDTPDVPTRLLTPREKNMWTSVLADLGFFHQYPVPSRVDIQREMLDRYRGFWCDHVLAETPPPVQGYGDILSLFPAPVGTLVAPPEISDWVSEYRDITKELGSSGNMGKRKDQLKTLVLDWARKQEGFAIDDESQEKVMILDATGKRLATYNGKMFRA
jgi:hypothetical protein